LVAVDDLGASTDDGSDGSGGRHLARDCLRVTGRQRRARPAAEAHAAARCLTRHDEQVVRPQALDALGHGPLRTLADLDHCDDGADADHDAERGECGAQYVASQGEESVVDGRWQDSHGLLPAATSGAPANSPVSMSPSRIWMARSQNADTSGSCVTSMTVR